LETTQIRSGFFTAWTEGAKRLSAEQPGFVDVDSASVRYPPGPPAPPASSATPALPDTTRLRGLWMQDIGKVRAIRAARNQALLEEAQLQPSVTAAARKTVDSIRVAAGRPPIPPGRTPSTSALEPPTAPEVSSRAAQLAADLAMNDYPAAAESVFMSVLSQSPGSPLALCGLGNLAWLGNDPLLAAAYYRAATDRDSLDAPLRLNLALAL